MIRIRERKFESGAVGWKQGPGWTVALDSKSRASPARSSGSRGERRREAQQIAALIASAPRPAELSPPPRLAPAAPRPQPSWVEGPSLAWPAGGAVLLGLAALVARAAAGHPAADVLFSAGAAAMVGLLLGCAVDFVWAFLRA